MNICLFTASFLPKVAGMEIVIDRLAREYIAWDTGSRFSPRRRAA